ncbi:hypothetical protein BRD56_01545 [Thermoplasmatales archaeon SW_10_69_26]|nr:MAG: hypothetical protein BRD56_01545 [Thermoplasmatales archaeon SW_10_69_26]
MRWTWLVGLVLVTIAVAGWAGEEAADDELQGTDTEERPPPRPGDEVVSLVNREGNRFRSA